jgi:hypothetical protein
MNKETRMNWTHPFDYPKGQSITQAEYVRQDNVVFKWDEIVIRYRPTTDDTSHIEWVEGRV